MSIETQLESILITMLNLNAYISTNQTPVRHWTDDSVDEKLSQVIVRAEDTEIMERYPDNGKALLVKYKLSANCRTYLPDDKNCAICNALNDAVSTVVNGLDKTDFTSLTGGKVGAVRSETGDTSLTNKYNVRISVINLIVAV